MLWIKYQVVQSTVGEEDVLVNKKIGYSEANIAIAEAEAYNGKYEVVEDGKSYNDEPLAIEFGGTGAKTAAEALQKIGAAPAGYVAYTGWFNSDDMLTTKLTEAYAGIADNKIGFAELESTSNTITLTQGKWFFTMYRSSAEYGVVTAIRYDSANVVAIMQRSLIGGTWGAWKNGSPSAFAPSWYGLGELGAYCDNCNNAIKNGWFWVNGNTANIPESGMSGVLFVETRNSSSGGTDYYQTVTSGAQVYRRYYSSWASEWQPWECENPPMELGKEYRTTERWEGKPVYTVLINCGILPSTGVTTTTAIPSPIYGTIDKIIRCGGTTSEGNLIPFTWNGEYMVVASASRSSIFIYSRVENGSNTATIQLWYTKW